MGIPQAYVVSHGRIRTFLDAIQTAGVPERVTFEFLKTLGLTSSNDRSIITVMKAIGFLDSNGSPTSLYKQYRSNVKGGSVLAEAVRTAYSDIFLANMKANELSSGDLRDIVATKTDKGGRVIKEIVATFKALCDAADFSASEDRKANEENDPSAGEGDDSGASRNGGVRQPPKNPAFHYNIQIHLPTTADISVYNAIFKSLREHLL